MIKLEENSFDLFRAISNHRFRRHRNGGKYCDQYQCFENLYTDCMVTIYVRISFKNTINIQDFSQDVLQEMFRYFINKFRFESRGWQVQTDMQKSCATRRFEQDSKKTASFTWDDSDELFNALFPENHGTAMSFVLHKAYFRFVQIFRV